MSGITSIFWCLISVVTNNVFAKNKPISPCLYYRRQYTCTCNIFILAPVFLLNCNLIANNHVFFCCLGAAGGAKMMGVENRLISHILQNYSRYGRPIADISKPVQVTISFYLTQLMSLVSFSCNLATVFKALYCIGKENYIIQRLSTLLKDLINSYCT